MSNPLHSPATGYLQNACWVQPKCLTWQQVSALPRHQNLTTLYCKSISTFFCFSNEPSSLPQGLCIFQSLHLEPLSHTSGCSSHPAELYMCHVHPNQDKRDPCAVTLSPINISFSSIALITASNHIYLSEMEPRNGAIGWFSMSWFHKETLIHV